MKYRLSVEQNHGGREHDRLSSDADVMGQLREKGHFASDAKAVTDAQFPTEIRQSKVCRAMRHCKSKGASPRIVAWADASPSQT